MVDMTLTAGLSLAEHGFATHWLRPRSKAPVAQGWSTAPVADISTLRRTYLPGYNVGVRCGRSSTPGPGLGLVVMDTDVKVAAYAPEALKALAELLDGDLDGPSVASGRRNGSRHDWRACPLDRLPPRAAVVVRKAANIWIPPNKDRPEPVWHIEVLSTGKQVVVPPSTHPTTGHRYTWITPLGPLPILPEAVHVALDEALASSVRLSPYDDAATPWTGQHITTAHRPGDEFNARADWGALLERHGWTLVRRQGETTYWRRPGKREAAWSASVNYGGRNLLYVFSSAAPPFEADRAYCKFMAFTLLEFGGDFRAAARALAPLGYSTPRNQAGRRRRITQRPDGLWVSKVTRGRGIRTVPTGEVPSWRA
jgi:Bifunctional DNA primase/polymerase, N-terminal